MSNVKAITVTLWPLEQPTATHGPGVVLGEQDADWLKSLWLAEGERVLLVEPNELQAEATIRSITLHGRAYWFGEIGDPDAIQVIYPEPASAINQSGNA